MHRDLGESPEVLAIAIGGELLLNGELRFRCSPLATDQTGGVLPRSQKKQNDPLLVGVR